VILQRQRDIFRMMVRRLNNCPFSKTNPTRSRSASSDSPKLCVSIPKILQLPFAGGISPAVIIIKSLLPDCCCPATTQNSPAVTVQFTSSSAVRLVSRMEQTSTPRISMTAVLGFSLMRRDKEK
jgi:hypothetical protein